MHTLILDNFDSFTYNLYQYLAELGANPEVYRNNEITLRDIVERGYTHIVISPGPGSPDNKKDFGICGEVIQTFKSQIPILGVCLGHQGIIHTLGGHIIRTIPMHGKRSVIRIKNSHSLFQGLPEKVEVMRYHSLIGDRRTLPKELDIIGETEEGLIMAVAHKTLPLFGVQFHPESIGTAMGKVILKNFLLLKQKNATAMTEKEAEQFIDNIVIEKIHEQEIEEIVLTLAQKGESIAEITGMARGLRKHAIQLPGAAELITTDTCGTGGSGLQRMNISTAVAFVLASAHVKIAKHGNRAASGRCGSFDVLEALGVNIQISPEQVTEAIKKIGIGFIFAPLFHPAMKKVAPVRKKLGIRTIFNLLGPLTNPAHPKYHLLGTTSPAIAEKLIHVMKNLNYRHVIVVSGEDSLDEVTLTGRTIVFELVKNKIKKFEFQPEDIGLPRVKNFKKISGGSMEENAKMFVKLLRGKAPKDSQNLLLVNCAFGFLVAEKARNVKEGLRLAKKTIASGAAYKKFQKYKKFSLPSFRDAIRGKEKISVIAEIKRYSPSYDKEFPHRSIAELVRAYELGRASALSVVTAPVPFKGSLDFLREARKLTKLPIIRKDFLSEPHHIDESIDAGADAILLIAHKLKRDQLHNLVAYAQKRNIDPVVEIHFDKDLEKIAGLEGIVVGINNRNLKNFSTNVNHALSLMNKLDPHLTIIAESAFQNISDLAPYKGKIDAVLIGTALLTAFNPLEKLSSFTHSTFIPNP